MRTGFAVAMLDADQLASMRATVAGVRVSTCTVTRPTGIEPTFDPNTGTLTTPSTTVFTGGCKIAPAETRGSEVEAGQEEVTLLDFVGRFPVDADITEPDVVTITASTDPGMVGERFRVTDVLWRDYGLERVVALEHLDDT